MEQECNQKDGATRQVGDAKSEGGDEAGRNFLKRSWRGTRMLPKGGGAEKGKGPKRVGEATGRRG